MIQTAEGALSETQDILQRMRELANQSANGTNTVDDRTAIQDEVKQLKEEIDRIGNTTEFNTQKLLNGNLKSAGGASVGQNVTTGSAVAKLESAKSAGVAMDGAAVAAGEFIEEKITIDGTDITVKWQNLSTEQQNIIISGTAASANDSAEAAAAELITKTINDAIDASGANVAHVKGYRDSTGKFVLQSGSEGINSSIKTDGGGAVGEKMIAASTAVTGTSKFSGATVASGSTFTAEINGVQMKVTTTGAFTNSTTVMEDGSAGVADLLEKILIRRLRHITLPQALQIVEMRVILKKLK